MRAAILRRAAPIVVAAAMAAALTACSGTPAATPAPTPSRPPLTAELSGGTPVQLGGAGHWIIAGGRAYATVGQGTVVATDLATGVEAWRAAFGQGQAWDAQPTIGLSADRRTVVAVRTVDADTTPRLGLLLIDAGTGAVRAEHLVSDAAQRWRVDLPPRVLAADDTTVVLADNPEVGRRTGVVAASDGTLAWAADEQAVAATAQVVITRNGARSRADGSWTWRPSDSIGTLLAQGPSALVVQNGRTAAWIDVASGRSVARIPVGEAEPPCAATTDTVVCLGAGVTGHSLADGERRWSAAEPADAIVTVFDWAYLWRGGSGRGDVLDARTGAVLEHDVALPPIRFSDADGVLLGTDAGYRWVPWRR